MKNFSVYDGVNLNPAVGGLPFQGELAESAGMGTQKPGIVDHLLGEQPTVEPCSAVADTFAGRVHVEWDATAPVTPFGQLPFFIDYLKQAGLFDAFVADCPLSLTSNNAPKKRDLLGAVPLSVLSGHRRYAHITALRCDPVNPSLLGMRKVCSEDAVRRGLAKIGEAKGLAWLQNHLDYCTTPLLNEPWVLDMDSTVKTLYGHQEGAEVGYNPHKPGRPSHAYHTYMLSSLRLILRVDVLPGDEYNVAHATDGLWKLLDHLGPGRRPTLLRGDKSWGIERVMARAEQNDLAYLFRLRMTVNVKRDLERAMRHSDWADAGQGWQGKETTLRLLGWSRQRRVILLRRKLARDLAITEQANPAQPRLTFAEIGPDKAVWEYAALVTSLDREILTLGQLYRDRADCENVFDELEESVGMGRLHDTGPDTLPAARRDGSADLQLVEFVRASGRSRASSRSHHFPASPAVGHRAQDPARRAGDADDQQHAWPARQGTPRLCPHRWLPGGPAAKCRAVKPAGKMVPHPQRSPPTLPARAAASATAAPQPRMNTYHGLQRSCHHRQRDRPTAGFRVKSSPASARFSRSQ